MRLGLTFHGNIDVMISSKDLLYTTGNSTQQSVIMYMGRVWRKTDIWKCITETGGCIPKQTRLCKSTIFQYTIKINFKKKGKEKKRQWNCPSGLGDLWCSHIPGAWAFLGLTAGLGWSWGSWGGCASKGAPMNLEHLAPGARDPRSRWAPLRAQPSLVQPHNGGPSGLKELWQGTWSLNFPMGVPTSSQLPRSRPTWAPQHSGLQFGEGLGFLWGCRIRGKKSWDSSHGSVHSNLQPRNRTFARAPAAPGTWVKHEEVLPPCGHLL